MDYTHRLADLNDENAELKEKLTAQKEWIERLMEFVNMPDDQRSAAVREYVVNRRITQEFRDLFGTLNRLNICIYKILGDMTQKEYVAAIKKQLSLIRKLFCSRKRRSEVIQKVTNNRYQHLVGRFFRPKGDEFRYVDSDSDYYIYSVTAVSNVTSDDVLLCLNCRYVSRTYRDTDTSVIGIDIFPHTFHFTSADDLDELLADKFVDKEKAINTIEGYYTQFINSLLKHK